MKTRFGMSILPGEGMSDQQFAERAATILHSFSLENTGWRGWFRRWRYPDEPLRNDAANLLRQYGITLVLPSNTRVLGGG